MIPVIPVIGTLLTLTGLGLLYWYYRPPQNDKTPLDESTIRSILHRRAIHGRYEEE